MGGSETDLAGGRGDLGRERGTSNGQEGEFNFSEHFPAYQAFTCTPCPNLITLRYRCCHQSHAVIMPILQMRKPRSREVKGSA